jgi:ketosteroid isomerase-like protein
VDQATEQLVRDAYAAFLASDFDALQRVLAPDAIYVNPPYALEGGTRRGADSLVEMWRDTHQLFDLESLDIEELREGPRGIFLMLRVQASGRGSGAPANIDQAHVVRMRDGLVSELHWFRSREEGLEAAGLVT